MTEILSQVALSTITLTPFSTIAILILIYMYNIYFSYFDISIFRPYGVSSSITVYFGKGFFVSLYLVLEYVYQLLMHLECYWNLNVYI